MEQSALLGQSGNVGEVFLVIYERLREVVYFFAANWLALLAVTLPFAVASTLAVAIFGQPLPNEGEETVQTVAWQSALLLLLIYPLALGVKVLAIHRIASGEPLSAAGLLLPTLRLWPTLMALSLLTLLLAGAIVLMSLGMGLQLLQTLGLSGGPAGGLLLLFFLPGIYLYARLGCAPVIAVTEGLTAMEAISAAWQRSLARHADMFWSLLLLGSALLLVLLVLFGLLGKLGGADDMAPDEMPLAASLFAQIVGEWLFCLLTITFYRYWSLLPRSA